LIVPPTGVCPGAACSYRPLPHEGGTSGFRRFAAVIAEHDAATVVLVNHTRSVARFARRKPQSVQARRASCGSSKMQLSVDLHGNRGDLRRARRASAR
jgi:hypothetical protein